MKHFIRGFTLVELMVIVGIVGILSAIAIPVYTGYVVRSRVTEGIMALSQCREVVSEIYQLSEPGFTVSANQWGCGENITETEFVSLVNTDVDGVVTITFRNLGDSDLDGGTMQMIPQHDGVDVVISDLPVHVNGFVCEPGGPNPMGDSHVPHTCR